MPKIVSYTPPWLSGPSPGAKIFTDPAPQSPTSPSKRASQLGAPNGSATADYQGPRRLLARRGTEIFTVVGNKLRWSDLSTVKRNWEANGSGWKGGSKFDLAPEHDEGGQPPYRTLSVPVYYQIRQLIISPSGVFLAICTEHTVHIAVLPDSARLKDQDQSPLKLKTYQLGPTTHVIPESPITSALWHPLAVATNSSDCLVTVTAEAAVRVWEIDRSNQWSFERPALAIDLKKLADGNSCEDDFEPSGFGKSRGFSVDQFDMEASAACFGGQGQPEDDPWSSMTLWAAMRNGDLYALCPLLPSRWLPTTTTIPSLSTRAVSQAALADDEQASPEQRTSATQQYEWVQEIDSDEQLTTSSGGDQEEVEICRRPSNPSAIPRLQGPFEINLDDDFIDLEVSDIHVISAKLDEDELLAGEDYADLDNERIEGMPVALVSLATTDGKVYICMDLEGVSGQWLPKKGRNSFAVPDSDTKELTFVETFSSPSSGSLPATNNWPMLAPNPSVHHSFFFATGTRIFSISLSEWCSRVGPEMFPNVEEDSGLQTRLSAACQMDMCEAEEVIGIEQSGSDPRDQLSAPIVFDDTELGSMLLASTPSKVYAVSFDQEDSLLEDDNHDSGAQGRSTFSPDPEIKLNFTQAARPAYQVPNTFLLSSTGPINSLLNKVPASRQQMLKQPLRLSPATLEIMTSAHRLLSKQTSNLEQAAAELFRRCERMRSELTEQVTQMAELADRLQHITAESLGSGSSKETLENRMARAHTRQKELNQKYESVRRKTAQASNVSRELSESEVAWISEVQDLSNTFGLKSGTITVDDDPKGISGRFQTIKQLAEELMEESKTLARVQAVKESSDTLDVEVNSFRRSTNLVSSKLQKEKINDVMAMVEREGAVIDAVMARLDRLTVGK